jgi:hypothetical protein
MADLIHEHSAITRGTDGSEYRARIYGAEREDGTWTGWIQFVPADESKPSLATGQETSQPDRTAVEYWAGGLEPIYLEGALARARRAATRAD